MLMIAETVDVDAALDRARLRGLPLTVLICSIVTLALDGFDIQVIGFVAPTLTAEFAVGRGALAPTLAASLIGMTLGDRRRPARRHRLLLRGRAAPRE